MRDVLQAFGSRERHWVGDGFPVRSLFSYGDDPAAISPFLLLDYAGPHDFAPAASPRGIGAHPHRGFETVTLVYEGEVEHRDSAGNGGVIGPGDVQWMTAGAGILHQEHHSRAFTRSGGAFRMVQLWVNLPARDKSAAPGYQSLRRADIPVVPLPGGAGVVRVIAGDHAGARGPARTFTPMNVWDVRLRNGAEPVLDLPEDHTALLVVLDGQVALGATRVAEAEGISLNRGAGGARVRAERDSTLLVLTGAPIHELVVGQGPFVMNSREELRQAFEDFRRGRFGGMAA